MINKPKWKFTGVTFGIRLNMMPSDYKPFLYDCMMYMAWDFIFFTVCWEREATEEDYDYE